MKDSERIIEGLQSNSEKLISSSWYEMWGFRTGKDQPLKLSVTHTITPGENGSYKLRSVIGFGVRISHHLDTDVAQAEAKSLAHFPDTRAA